MEIYLVRHTKVALSMDYCYDISDVELGDSQQDDTHKVAAKLSSIRFQKAFTSPLKRCKLLADKLSAHAEEKEELLEMDFGNWELKKWDDLDRQEVDIWMNDFVNECPPNGESYIDFSIKVCSFLISWLKTATPLIRSY